MSLELDAVRARAVSPDWPGPHGRPQRAVTGRPFEPCVETADIDPLVDRLRVAGVPYTCARRCPRRRLSRR